MSTRPSSEPSDVRGRPPWWFPIALLGLYLVAVAPRLTAVDFDAPDLTYGDERRTLLLAEQLLTQPDPKIPSLSKPPGTARFCALVFRPYYRFASELYGWESLDDVHWWRVRHYWRTVNAIVSGLLVLVVGGLGAAAFHWRVGLLAATLVATSRLAAIWSSVLKEEGLTALVVSIALVAGWKILSARRRRLPWVLLAGVATGAGLACKPTAAPLLVVMPAVIVLASDAERGRWLRTRLLHLVVFGLVAGAVLVAIVPEVLTEWTRFTHTVQSPVLNPLASKERLAERSLPGLLRLGWKAWSGTFHAGVQKPVLGPVYPFYFFALLTAIVAGAPLVAWRRRDRFLGALWLFVVLLWAAVTYQWFFGQAYRHYFMAGLGPLFLIAASGLDGLAGMLSRWLRGRPGPTVVLLLIVGWPIGQSYRSALAWLEYFPSTESSSGAAKEIRLAPVRSFRPGGRLFLPVDSTTTESVAPGRWSDAFRARREFRSSLGVDDLRRLGFDLAVQGDKTLPSTTRRHVRELREQGVEPRLVVPRTSFYRETLAYLPIAEPDEPSFGVSLYLRTPDVGDWAGVEADVPLVHDVGRPLHVEARLSHHDWQDHGRPYRWQLLADREVVWESGATSVWHADPPFGPTVIDAVVHVEPGASLTVRTLRAGAPRRLPRGGGPRSSSLKIDALRVTDVKSGERVLLPWRYGGRRGGPGPALYAQRQDWFGDPAPAALVDTGFERTDTLVTAWRPGREIDPPEREPWHLAVRRASSIERVAGAGVRGSAGLRLALGLPAPEGARLRVMQPVVQPSAPGIDVLRLRYRAVALEPGEGGVRLRVGALGLSLSGVEIGSAFVERSLIADDGAWHTLELLLGERWRERRTRVDLIDFLELTIEVRAGPGATFEVVIDDVETLTVRASS